MSRGGFTEEERVRGLATRARNNELRRQGLLPPRKRPRVTEPEPTPVPEPAPPAVPDPADLLAAVVRRDSSLREQVARALGRLEGQTDPLIRHAAAILCAALRGEVAP